MKKEELELITQTIEGHPVKNLRWLPTDNIIVGLVRCPFLGNPNLNDGYTSGAWRKNGCPTNKIKGFDHLYLEIPK